jgi:hypothetical protein
MGFNIKGFLPPIFGGTKTLKGDIKWLGSKMPPYLAGKEGYLPNWQIKGKGLKEIYAPSQYLKAGKMIRGGITDRTTAMGTGIFGIGAVEYAQGKEGWLPDWGRPGQFPKIVDPSGTGKGLVNIEIPEFPEFPKIPSIGLPDIALPDMSGGIAKIGEGMGTGMTGIGAGLAQGLAGLGAGLGGGIPKLPTRPSMELVDEDGAPNLLLIGGLALIAYKVLGGRK